MCFSIHDKKVMKMFKGQLLCISVFVFVCMCVCGMYRSTVSTGLTE